MINLIRVNQSKHEKRYTQHRPKVRAYTAKNKRISTVLEQAMSNHNTEATQIVYLSTAVSYNCLNYL